MSRLRIEHTTVYHYRRRVIFGQHRLVLRPREGHDLHVDSMTLQISPEYHLVWARDVYSNSVAIVDFLETATKLEFRSIVTVVRSLPFPLPPGKEEAMTPLPVEYDVLETPVAAVYQTVSYADDLHDVRSWLQSFPELTKSNDAETTLIGLCAHIADTIKYQRRYAKGVQTPSQTLKLGTGSCRDVATLMMEAARSLGLAARFVSGYLDCPASEAGRASMHAWTEVYLPVVGWKGYDPTLGEPVSLKHILVAVSHHPRGVMPVSGLFTGAPADFIEMVAQVKIEHLDEQILDPGTSVTPSASSQGRERHR